MCLVVGDWNGHDGWLEGHMVLIDTVPEYLLV